MSSWTKTFSWADVTEGDERRIVVDGRVYNVEGFVNQHPGGAAILSYVNKDGTDAFAAFHPPSATETLANFYEGDLVAEAKEELFLEDIRKLRSEFEQLGYYRSSKVYYALKSLSTMVFAAASFFVLQASDNLGSVILSALLLAVFWQQCGWLSHDFLHHQVFKDRRLNRFFGYFYGNVCQGFSVSWWCNKHNTHHSAPNVHDNDPDIDTMPFLAWSEHAIEGFSDLSEDTVARLLISNQGWLYFAIMAIARVSWLIQSVLWLAAPVPAPWVVDRKEITVERVTLFLHWVFYLGLIVSTGSIANAFVFLVTSQCACGLLLALVFSLNHNGMPVLKKADADKHDFFTLQILTSRNVHPSLFANWFTGGLGQQIEHHLFPTLPRHNFSLVQPRVAALCKKYQIPYHSTGFWSGTMEVVARLKEIATLTHKLHNL